MLNSYRPSRDEIENVARMLYDNYPKCFFENPRHRRPMKKDIAMDVINDKSFDVAPEMIHAAVDWYKSHLGYHIASSTAGTKRIGLDGKDAGTVTESEAIAEQQEAARINKMIAEQRSSTVSSPVEVMQKMHATGKITDDGVKKLDAIPRSKPAPIAPEFAQLYETFTNANVVVVGINDATMRLAVAKATLDEVIRKAEQVKAELQGAR